MDTSNESLIEPIQNGAYENMKNSDIYDINFDYKTRFKEFDPEDIPEHFNMVIAAKRRSGKTHLIRHLLKPIHKRFDEAYLFSETAHLQDNPYDFIDKKHQYKSFEPSVIRDIINRQLKKIEEIKNSSIKNKDKQNDEIPKILILLDDVIADPKVRTCSELKCLAVEGRHLRLSICNLTQYIGSKYGFPTVILNNADIFIAFMLHDEWSRQTAVERYLSTIDKKEGHKILNAITHDEYTAIICNLSIPNIRVYEDYVYYYRAPKDPPRKYRINSKLTQELNGKNIKYNVEFKDPSDNHTGIVKARNRRTIV